MKRLVVVVFKFDYNTIYKKLFNYLKEKILKIYKNKKIVNDLGRYGSIPSNQVKYHMQFGKVSTIKLMEMDSGYIYGLYNCNIISDTIFIN